MLIGFPNRLIPASTPRMQLNQSPYYVTMIVFDNGRRR